MNSKPLSGIDEARREEREQSQAESAERARDGYRRKLSAAMEEIHARDGRIERLCARTERIEAAARQVVEEKGVLGQRSCEDHVNHGWRECRQRKVKRLHWCQGCDLAQSIDDLAAALEGA